MSLSLVNPIEKVGSLVCLVVGSIGSIGSIGFIWFVVLIGLAELLVVSKSIGLASIGLAEYETLLKSGSVLER